MLISGVPIFFLPKRLFRQGFWYKMMTGGFCDIQRDSTDYIPGKGKVVETKPCRRHGLQIARVSPRLEGIIVNPTPDGVAIKLPLYHLWCIFFEGNPSRVVDIVCHPYPV
jgi:hypothetical protein